MVIDIRLSSSIAVEVCARLGRTGEDGGRRVEEEEVVVRGEATAVGLLLTCDGGRNASSLGGQ